ncbi:hypothetical protein ACKWRH_25000 [Bradyrhizobium sp. Pa8]|uniref:hypothetical protein n=1 Tax=Bradyrhizobium sp. Pa8 TaxID=3386552 RepID=UPI00403F100A
MSPTQFEVRRAELGRLLDAARFAGDVGRMQSLLAAKTSLYRSMYGAPENA